jgi:nucleoside-diphosphate-sugar epimerase
MIVGRGLIATAFAPQFADDSDITIFASGVANSRDADVRHFERERLLLESELRSGRRIVYFGTCSVQDPALLDSPYVLHKLEMEDLLRQSGASTILRLPQVVGRSPNPSTLTNFLYGKILRGEPIQVWKGARRNIIDIHDVARIGGYLIQEQSEGHACINIACPFSVSVEQLVVAFEKVLGIHAHVELVDAGGSYEIDVTDAMRVARKLGLRFESDYVMNVVRKYYGE